MKKVIVGSENPVKLDATKESFAIVFPDVSFEYVTFPAQSGVPEQPFGTIETKTGAKNRADACRKEYPDADFFVGLEGGLEDLENGLWAFAWMCILDTKGNAGYGRTGSFLIPKRVTQLVHAGEELGIATDIAFNETNTKHKNGTVGLLTNDTITRKDFYRDALIFALIPFLKPELY